jgi:putative endonuclease
MFYVYLLHSISDSGFYIGFSTDLRKRIPEHKHGASFATKSRGPWKLIYYEAYAEREEARRAAFLRLQLRHYLKKFPPRTAT